VGDRSQIIVNAKEFKTPVTFYGHWSGEDNITAVRNVLARTGRIGDVSYLTAQIFYEFAKLGEYDGELSFGIDAFGSDPEPSYWSFSNNNPTVYVDADTGTYTYKGKTYTEFTREVKNFSDQAAERERAAKASGKKTSGFSSAVERKI
jgi:hypothetical protein